MRQEVERLQATLERHRGELGKEMRSDLSSEDQQELASLENQIEQLRSRHKQIHDDADQVEFTVPLFYYMKFVVTWISVPFFLKLMYS